MSTKIIMRFSCDICGATSDSEELTGAPRKVNLPKDWSEVIHVDKRRSSDIHLCPLCTGGIKDGTVVRQEEPVDIQKRSNKRAREVISKFEAGLEADKKEVVEE